MWFLCQAARFYPEEGEIGEIVHNSLFGENVNKGEMVMDQLGHLLQTESL